MAKHKKRHKNKGLVLYWKISKQFTKANATLPKDQQLPYALRRKIIKEQVYPNLKGRDPKGLYVGKIREYIGSVLENMPSKLFDLRFLPPASYTSVEYFMMDELITNVVPANVFVRVSAGEYGNTDIFNTLNYDYTGSGVQGIVEALRPEEKRKGYYPEFTGIVKVRPAHKDDHYPHSYFLDMVLAISGKPIEVDEEDEEIHFKPKTEEEKEEAKDVREAIHEKMDKLHVVKTTRKKKAKKEKQEKQAKEEAKQKKQASKMEAETEFIKESNKYINNIMKLVKQGLMSKAAAKKEIEKTMNMQHTQAKKTTTAKQIPLGKAKSAPVKPSAPAKKAAPKPTAKAKTPVKKATPVAKKAAPKKGKKK